jgi:two-component system LytT family response regulator
MRHFTLNLAIIHTEKAIISALQKALQKVCPPILEVTEIWDDVSVFLEKYSSATPPTIVFADAATPSSAALLETLLPIRSCIVVLCAAAEAVSESGYDEARRIHQRYGADMLFMPFADDAVRDVLERSRNQLTGKIFHHVAEEMFAEHIQASSAPPASQLLLTTARGQETVRLAEILFCEANGQNTNLFTINQEGAVQKMLVFVMLADIEKMLPKRDFVRVHNSFIVQVQHIALFQHNAKDGTLTMQDTSIIPVSRTYKKALLEYLQPKRGDKKQRK